MTEVRFLVFLFLFLLFLLLGMIDKTLSPHRLILHTLMFDPKTGLQRSDGLAWLDIQKKSFSVIHWNGTLSSPYLQLYPSTYYES
ncbi:hypothetical protein IW261DRAFT_1510626 [Armillaria novae-zelandiae]|uniref:Uncharacterized protein n=1 Tax=Armillaria novae-zelandiae TaxID=153914 RepID=A0AA39NUE1_9AGAR|nr:hypothetical protein IW261DRAFT_1510626 [Armillaria novae-zelandiae]